MLNWIYRRRARMAAVYGRVEAGPLAGERFAAPSPAAPLRSAAAERPGETVQSGRYVVVRPMPPRASSGPRTSG